MHNSFQGIIDLHFALTRESKLSTCPQCLLSMIIPLKNFSLCSYYFDNEILHLLQSNASKIDEFASIILLISYFADILSSPLPRSFVPHWKVSNLNKISQSKPKSTWIWTLGEQFAISFLSQETLDCFPALYHQNLS